MTSVPLPNLQYVKSRKNVVNLRNDLYLMHMNKDTINLVRQITASGMIFILPAFLALLILNHEAAGQSAVQIETASKEYFSDYPRQKVYLHFDKMEYFAGDDIWFKAYVLNAHNHNPDKKEATLYVDLYNANETLIKKHLVKIENGYGIGDFQLHDSLSEGNYLVRAYTPWMLNFDNSYVFTKHIFINNPEEKNYISRSKRRENRRFNRAIDNKREDFVFEQYPEGGKLIDGLQSRVAFFAGNALGKGVEVTAVLETADGKIQKTHQSDEIKGRGYVDFVPDRSVNYFWTVLFPDGETRTFPLKDISEYGHVLRVDHTDEGFDVSLQSKPHQSKTDKYPLFLSVHTRGAIYEFMEIHDGENPIDLQVSQEYLPTGVSVATLFDRNAEVVSERMLFNKPDPSASVSLESQKKADNLMQLNVNLPELQSDSTAISVAITGSPDHNFLFRQGIVSELYVHSDIHRTLEIPDIAFHSSEENSQKIADLVMLTTDWQRYDWPDIVDSGKPDLKYQRLKGFPIRGALELTDQSEDLDRRNFEVSLQIGDEDYLRLTTADSDGKFRFDSIKESGTFRAEIGVLGLDGSTAQAMELNPEMLPDFPFEPDFQFRALIESRGSIWTRVARTRPSPSDRKQRIREELPHSHGRADHVIYLNEDDRQFTSLRDVLSRRVPGVSISGNRIAIRGQSSYETIKQPLLLVDGQTHTNFEFLNLRTTEISHIEVYKGRSASVFGIRGAHGTIVAHRYVGVRPQSLIFEYLLSGYYIPRAFSQTQTFDADDAEKPKNYLQTLHWKPYVKLDESGSSSFELFIPDHIKKIHVVLEGVDAQGSVIQSVKTIEP